tara:strand:- start:6163 stop:7386 length:1224 start_codon:yes stop_codon:yes gene_type:complete
MEVIKADFVMTTPMFLGEASGPSGVQCAQLIRPPSLKGALRFWWRALQWAAIRHQESSEAAALSELHKQEAALFGQTAKTDANGHMNGGQGQFLLRLHKQKVGEPTDKDFTLGKAPLQYLLGQGLFSYKTKLQRQYLQAGGSFTVELALKPGISSAQRQQLLDTLECFGLLGGLGSRARKGYGSVSLTHLEDAGQTITLPDSASAFKRRIQSLASDALTAIPGQEEPPFSAFSNKTCIQIAQSGANGLSLLNQHGYEMGMYRGYGREGVTFGGKAEQKFKQDHDWAYAVAKGKRQNTLPKRIAFGLPHPYFLSSGAKISVDVTDHNGGNARRASPLLAHIHQLPDGQCLLIHLVLKARFLPSEMSVDVKGDGAKFNLKGKQVDASVDWIVLDNFLDRFQDKDTIHHG